MGGKEHGGRTGGGSGGGGSLRGLLALVTWGDLRRGKKRIGEKEEKNSQERVLLFRQQGERVQNQGSRRKAHREKMKGDAGGEKERESLKGNYIDAWGQSRLLCPKV